MGAKAGRVSLPPLATEAPTMLPYELVFRA